LKKCANETNFYEAFFAFKMAVSSDKGNPKSFITLTTVPSWDSKALLQTLRKEKLV